MEAIFERQRNKLDCFLNQLDELDGTSDGIIADNIWSTFEHIYRIKSSQQNSNGEIIMGVNVDDAYNHIIKNNAEKYG